MTPVRAGGAGRLGAVPTPDGATRFEVWAPSAGSVEVDVADRLVAMEHDDTTGTWVAVVDGVGHGDRYCYRLGGGEPLADPASGWQPDGVHGPSAVVDTSRYVWTDDGWTGVELADTVLYELHVGTFTPDGTFDVAIGQLDRLVRLGITTVELMPVNAFAGRRNWGYDGVFASAVQASYGGPDGLARFVDAAHAAGLAVVLDVVYNHVGPEGSVLARFGPYFSDRYPTPWGDGLNISEAGSDHVRRTFLESATRWITDFHVDGLRVDAVDTIYDPTAVPFLQQLVDAVHEAGRAADRAVLVFFESAANDPAIVRPPAAGGLGADATWADDFHHSLRVALTGDRRGYYVDYDGAADLAHALAHRWVLDGRYSVFRDRHHGQAADDVEPDRFVVFSSNHDHVGNTPAGGRPPYDERARLVAAAAVVLSPFTPLLFMGEEYAETAPFPYFVDHGDPQLIAAVRQGRWQEFSHGEWTEAVADPADPATFEAAFLDPSVATDEPHRSVLAAYTELLALRRRHRVVHASGAVQDVELDGQVIVVDRRAGTARSVLVLNLGPEPAEIELEGSLTIAFDSGQWGASTPAIELGCDGRARVAGTTAALLVGISP